MLKGTIVGNGGKWSIRYINDNGFIMNVEIDHEDIETLIKSNKYTFGSEVEFELTTKCIQFGKILVK